MTYKAKGLVLKEIPVGENDKAVILLLEQYGKVWVNCRGARKQNSRFLAGTQVFTFGEYEIHSGITKNNFAFFSLSHVLILDSFYGLRLDFDCLYAAQYLLGLADFYLEDGVAADGVLSLLLKALSCLARLYQFKSYKDHERFTRFVDQVALLKLIQCFGYAPETGFCTECGKPIHELLADTSYGQKKLFFFSSGLVCRECRMNMKKDTFIEIAENTLSVVRRMLYTDFRRLICTSADSLEMNDYYIEADRIQAILELCIRQNFGWNYFSKFYNLPVKGSERD